MRLLQSLSITLLVTAIGVAAILDKQESEKKDTVIVKKISTTVEKDHDGSLIIIIKDDDCDSSTVRVIELEDEKLFNISEKSAKDLVWTNEDEDIKDVETITIDQDDNQIHIKIKKNVDMETDLKQESEKQKIIIFKSIDGDSVRLDGNLQKKIKVKYLDDKEQILERLDKEGLEEDLSILRDSDFNKNLARYQSDETAFFIKDRKNVLSQDQLLEDVSKALENEKVQVILDDKRIKSEKEMKKALEKIKEGEQVKLLIKNGSKIEIIKFKKPASGKEITIDEKELIIERTKN